MEVEIATKTRVVDKVITFYYYYTFSPVLEHNLLTINFKVNCTIVNKPEQQQKSPYFT